MLFNIRFQELNENKYGYTYWKYCYNSAKGSLVNQIFVTLPVSVLVERSVIYNDNYYIAIELAKIVFYMLCSDCWFFSLHYMLLF